MDLIYKCSAKSTKRFSCDTRDPISLLSTQPYALNYYIQTLKIAILPMRLSSQLLNTRYISKLNFFAS